ncbi:MAG: hypothetical protein J6S99_06215 [Bacteroidales bacterium]|nr:hypothetical protein [Bacteroidales bacterium]
MLTEILVPIFVCVILPVTVVFIVGRTKQNEINRKTEVMIKAIENGAQIDPEMFKSTEQPKAPKTLKQELVEKLTGGCVVSLMGLAFMTLFLIDLFMPEAHIMLGSWLPVAGGVMLAVGIGLLISYFAGKKILANEIKAEEEALKK